MDRAERPADSYDGPRAVSDKDSMADQIVDDLLPEDLDWREMVRNYPLPAVVLALVGGFLLGQRHGSDLLAALRGYVDREVSKNVQSLLGEDGFRDSR